MNPTSEKAALPPPTTYLEKIADVIGVERSKLVIQRPMATNGITHSFRIAIEDKGYARSKGITGDDCVQVAMFYMTQLAGCCGTCVSYHSSVNYPYQCKGVGTLINELRCAIAKHWRYAMLICTDKANNTPQVKIMRKNGWKTLMTARSPKTTNQINLYAFDLTQFTPTLQLGFNLAFSSSTRYYTLPPLSKLDAPPAPVVPPSAATAIAMPDASSASTAPANQTGEWIRTLPLPPQLPAALPPSAPVFMTLRVMCQRRQGSGTRVTLINAYGDMWNTSVSRPLRVGEAFHLRCTTKGVPRFSSRGFVNVQKLRRKATADEIRSVFVALA